METVRLGIIMNGVTGRMGTNQHLVRSICAIRAQGGVALADGRRVMPDPILVGRNADKLEQLAREHGVARWTTDLDAALANRDDTLYFDSASTGLRPQLIEQAIAAGKHIYTEKPVAPTLARGARRSARAAQPRRRQARRRAGQALAAGLAQAQDAGRQPASSDASCRCAASSATGCSKATGSRRSVRPGTTARRTTAASSSTCSATGATCSTTCSARSRASRASARRISRSAGTRAGSPYEATADDAAYATFELDGADGPVIAQINSSWATRVRRDDLVTFHVDGTLGSAVAGLTDCWTQPRANTPKPVWNPDVPQTIDFFAELAEGAEQPVFTTTRSRSNGSCSSGTCSKTRRSAGTCSKAPRACSSPSSACKSWAERRWIDVPALEAER